MNNNIDDIEDMIDIASKLNKIINVLLKLKLR